MTSNYSTTHYEDLAETPGPLPHPYLREPKLYISGLAPNVRKEDLADAFRFCVPYRPSLLQDESGRTLPGAQSYPSRIVDRPSSHLPIVGHIDFREISAGTPEFLSLSVAQQLLNVDVSQPRELSRLCRTGLCRPQPRFATSFSLPSRPLLHPSHCPHLPPYLV